MIIDHEKVIDVYTKRFDKSKWELMNRTDKGIQVRKRKQLNRLGFWSGLVLIPFWGIGFIIWLLAILDYALKQEKILFVSVDQMIEKMKEAK